MNLLFILGISLGIRIAYSGTKKLYKYKKQREELDQLFI